MEIQIQNLSKWKSIFFFQLLLNLILQHTICHHLDLLPSENLPSAICHLLLLLLMADGLEMEKKGKFIIDTVDSLEKALFCKK